MIDRSEWGKGNPFNLRMPVISKFGKGNSSLKRSFTRENRRIVMHQLSKSMWAKKTCTHNSSGMREGSAAKSYTGCNHLPIGIANKKSSSSKWSKIDDFRTINTSSIFASFIESSKNTSSRKCRHASNSNLKLFFCHETGNFTESILAFRTGSRVIFRQRKSLKSENDCKFAKIDRKTKERSIYLFRQFHFYKCAFTSRS